MAAFEELCNCDKDHMAHKVKEITIWPFIKKNFLTPGPKSNYIGDDSQEEVHLTIVFWDMSLRTCDLRWALRDE